MPIDDDVRAYYDASDEQARLTSAGGWLERERTRELLLRWLPEPPALVLDVGGGPGVHGLWLADRGYDVDLLDPVEGHVRQAAEASAGAHRGLRTASVGDARSLPQEEASVDVVLLLGPLYHLVAAEDRRAALAEARRVLRPGGLLVAAAISRWASTMDGGSALADPQFAAIVAEDVATGVHRNPRRVPAWFTTAYFHRPEELAAEVRGAGFDVHGPVAVEGPLRLDDVTGSLTADAVARERVLDAVRRVEREPALLGASPHLLVAARPSVDRAAGSPMPPSVPDGLRLELSRARLLPGRREEFAAWMRMLHDRYEECQATLPGERAAFEATFRRTDADGSEWMYHLGVIGTEGAGLDTSNAVDAAHVAYAMRVKEPGWEELEPVFMLAPRSVLDAVTRFARTGEE